MIKELQYSLVAIGLGAVAFFGYRCGGQSREKELADLAQKLVAAHKTIEVEKGLYAEKLIELRDLTLILDTSQDEIKKLKGQLDKTGAELLTHQKLVIKWKTAYEKLLEASQTDETPTEPPPANCPAIRKRVDFKGDLGPIYASGHTLTDPAEAFLKLEQTEPLIVTVSVAQERDGTWKSYATSSDDNLAVDISLAGVNPYVLNPKWYQKIWVELGATFLGDPAATVHAGYYGDRYSVGATCYGTTTNAAGCGATFGFRPFK